MGGEGEPATQPTDGSPGKGWARSSGGWSIRSGCRAVRRLHMRQFLASRLVGLPLLLLFGAAVAAQEPGFKPLPPDKAAGVAKLLAADLAEISDQLAGAPLAMVPDAAKAHGLYRAESGGGAVAVPVKGFD